MSVSDAEDAIKGLGKAHARAIENGSVKVVRTAEGLPDGADLYSRNEGVQAAYMDGVRYIVASENTPETIRGTYFHSLLLKLSGVPCLSSLRPMPVVHWLSTSVQEMARIETRLNWESMAIMRIRNVQRKVRYIQHQTSESIAITG